MGSELEVVKKRVFLKAAANLGVALNIGDLQGHIGVVFATQDAIESIKEFLDWAIEMAKKRGLDSIAIPAIGTGIGGLDYEETVSALREHLKEDRFPIYLCVR